MLDEVFVVGGGPSLIGFEWGKLKGKETVAVNAALFDIPQPTYFVTMDHSFLRKISPKKGSFKRTCCSKVFVCGMYHDYLQEQRGAIVDTRFNHLYRLEDFDLIVKSRNPEGMGLTFGEFRSGNNSGFCGLQLAVLLGYTKIRLLGFDLKVRMKRTHYHALYGAPRLFSTKLESYRNFFLKGLAQLANDRPDVEVISCVEDCDLNEAIEYKPVGDVL